MKNTPRTIYLLALLAVSPCAMNLVAGDFNSSAIGTTGAGFFSQGMGARPIAMGGAYAAVADDVSAVFWNPAGLTRSTGSSLLLMRANYLSDISFDYLSFASSKGGSAFGGSVGYMNAGSVDHTDASGGTLGSYRPRDYYGTLACASDLDLIGAQTGRYSAGVSAKFISSTLIEKAETFAFDAGLTAKTEPYGRPLRLGLVAQNLGPGLKYEKKRDPLPATFRLGGALNASAKWLFSAEVAAPRGNTPYLAAGAEHLAYSAGNMSVFLRAGINTLTLSGISGFNGVSGGLGATFSRASVDYAVVPFGELGVTHRLSLTLKFAGEGQRTSANYGRPGSVREASSKGDPIYFVN